MIIWKRMDGLTMLSTLAVRIQIANVNMNILVDISRVYAAQ
jgi:hypothetical protein